MSSQKHAEALYRDFEKLYRLAGLYQNNTRQMEKQLQFVDNNLVQHLLQPFGAGGKVQFDILMASVYHSGEEVFRSKTPEFTISYSLFYEGIKSLTFTGGLKAGELWDWILSVKDCLAQMQEDQDLASMLWRKSYPHIKVSLYSALVSGASGAKGDESDGGELTGALAFNISEDSEEFEAEFLKEVLSEEFSASNPDTPSGLEMIEWDLPDGDLVSKKLFSLGVMDDKASERLKKELADAAISDRAKGLVRFEREEVANLKQEIESYDQDQIQFNLVNFYLSLIEKEEGLSSKTSEDLLQAVESIVQAIVQRFHSGLVLFVLQRLGKWKDHPQLEKKFQSIQERLKVSLDRDENLAILAEAFEAPEKRRVAKELIHYVPPASYPKILQHQISRSLTQGQEEYLDLLLELEFPLGDALWGWGSEYVRAAIPFLSKKSWEGRDLFLVRALRSKVGGISEAALEHIDSIVIAPSEAVKTFQHLSSQNQRRWLSTLQKSALTQQWKGFINQGVRTGLWRASDEAVGAAWVSLFFKSARQEAVEYFQNYVKSRKFMLFPRYPKERELILSVAMGSREPACVAAIQLWLPHERNVLFQSADLKRRLQEFS